MSHFKQLEWVGLIEFRVKLTSIFHMELLKKKKSKKTTCIFYLENHTTNYLIDRKSVV